MKNVKAKTNEQIAMQVSANSIAVNLMLSIFKLIAGLMASSGAMISDAIHSASDVFSTIIVIIGVKISGKASDEDHPYGHDRFECVASIILAILLGVTGVGIGLTGVQKLTAGHYDTLAVPGVLALAAAVISIVVKEIMYWYTRNAAKKINSGACMASSLRCIIISRKFRRYLWSQNGIPDAGSSGQCCHLSVCCQGSCRHFQRCHQQDDG